MRTVNLIARQALELHGRRIAAGECFEAQALDAAALTYQQAAEFDPKQDQQTAAARAPVAAQVKRRPARARPQRGRRYSRRDLEAEE